MTVKTKLCGFTDKENVDLAVASGADFIGFIFYPPSKRYISPQKAGEISVDVPANIKKVAITVEPSNEQIEQIIQHLKPDFLQLYKIDKKRGLEIKKQFQIPIIKAFSISDKEDLKAVEDYNEIADYFLFDTKTKSVGGSGKSFDWKILENFKTNKNWFLSGGLNINNIEEALEITGAKMIDLSSGIEEVHGIKSPKLIGEFMKKIALINAKF
ncbi:MAG: phosphoribosylanthranilate isomerase [Rickettsiaceae bacterium]|jgi:phosphoribosylanthranilate isomerase|nr:phosphoribosylanthranilate isomerase [Rickettsiaceae bacterium]